MLVGHKDKDREISHYPRVLPVKRNGFTLIEILVTALILLVIIAALSLVLNIGNLSNTVSGAKLELQQEVRRAMDWIVKDLRQTSRWKLRVINQTGDPDDFNNVGDNDTFTAPEFPICTGYSGGNITWGTGQIRYSFDALNKKIIRSNTTQTWEFNHISNLEFRKIYVNMLGITILGEKTARGNIKPTFNLTTEVRLRNE